MQTYYIYKAVNKINGKLYIGKTNDFKSRVWQHLRCYEKEDCLFHRKLEEYGKENFDFEIVETTTSDEQAEILEKKYIEEWKTYSPYGYNMNMGGVGGHNARSIVCLTLNGEFVKRYRSAADAELDGYDNVNVLLCCKNKLQSCKKHLFMFEDDYKEHGAKQYVKPKPNGCRRIIQCDMQGNFIAEYESEQEASRATGAYRTTITGCLTGTYKSAKGFIFVYKENFPIKDIASHQKKKKGKKIAQVNKDTGEIIEVFDRTTDAARKLGVNYKGIWAVVDKPDRTAFGYKWISQ